MTYVRTCSVAAFVAAMSVASAAKAEATYYDCDVTAYYVKTPKEATKETPKETPKTRKDVAPQPQPKPEKFTETYEYLPGTKDSDAQPRERAKERAWDDIKKRHRTYTVAKAPDGSVPGGIAFLLSCKVTPEKKPVKQAPPPDAWTCRVYTLAGIRWQTSTSIFQAARTFRNVPGKNEGEALGSAYSMLENWLKTNPSTSGGRDYAFSAKNGRCWQGAQPPAPLGWPVNVPWATTGDFSGKK